MIRSVFSEKPLVNSKKPIRNSLNQQRSVILFHSGIKSEMTKKHYSYFLNEFREFYLIKNHDKLLEIEPKKLQEMVEDFVIYERNRNKSGIYIAGKISALKLFFSMNDITLNWIKLQKMIPEKRKSVGDKAYTTEQIQTLVKHCSHSFYRAIIHFMSASGVRVGCFQELKMKHLKDMPNGCKSVLVYADTRHEYHTFIHQEAVESLNEYLDSRRKKGEKITDDSWVFCSPRNNSISSKSHTISAGICRYVDKTLDRGKKDGRNEIMSSHGFRKRFDTVLKSNKSVNISLAEKLMGHSTSIPLDNSYFKPLIEQLFDEYQKAISELIIDKKYQLQSHIESQQVEIESLKEKNQEIENLQKTILQIQNNMLELQKRHTY
jgi:integrase/recombinase XerD